MSPINERMTCEQWIDRYRLHAYEHGSFCADIAFGVDEPSVAFLGWRYPDSRVVHREVS